MLAFGRFLDKPLERTSIDQTQVAFELRFADDGRLTPDERDDLNLLHAEEPALRARLGGDGFVFYSAKQAGRNTRLSCDHEMNAATLARLVLEAELRPALARGELRAHYQAKIRLAARVAYARRVLTLGQAQTVL